MTAPELRATTSLAAIFALRMLGLFMIMPVFSVYAKTIPGGDNVLLVGIALGPTASRSRCSTSSTAGRPTSSDASR